MRLFKSPADWPQQPNGWILAAAVVMLTAAGLVAFAQVGLDVIRDRPPFFDFRSVLVGLTAFERGVNPYSLTELREIYPDITFPFVYPPPVLVIFQWIARLDFDAVLAVHAALTLGAAAGLWALQRRWLSMPEPWLLLFFLFGFSAATVRSIATGNMSVILYAILFAAVWGWCRGARIWLYAAIAVLAAFKFYYLIFLGVPILMQDRHWPLKVGLTICAMGIYYGTSFVFYPELTSDFLTYSAENLKDDYGNGALDMGMTLFAELGEKSGLGLWKWWGTVPYAAVAIAVFALSYWRLRAQDAGRDRGDLEVRVLFSLIVVFLCLPRLKVYDIFPTVLPALALAQSALHGARLRLSGSAAALLLVALPVTTRFRDELAFVLFNHVEFWVLFAVWAWVLLSGPPAASGAYGSGVQRQTSSQGPEATRS